MNVWQQNQHVNGKEQKIINNLGVQLCEKMIIEEAEHVAGGQIVKIIPEKKWTFSYKKCG